jgi:glycosyltransferase involved in cell wall biosynthesis
LRGLRIGVNALYLIPGGVGGTEIYLGSLLRSLAAGDSRNDYFVYVNREAAAEVAGWLRDAGPRFRAVLCAVRGTFRPARILYEQFVLPRRLRADRIDVLLNPGFTMPALADCPSVTVFHDLQHKRHPEFFRGLDLVFWNVLLSLAARRSRRLIAVSPATAADLEKYLPVSGGKIRIVQHGVDPEMFRIGDCRMSERSERLILTVSTLHPHKNFERLLDAFARFHAAHPDYRLVVAGLKGFATEQILERCRALGLSGSVEFTGWIPREDLYALYARADAFIYPSLFEGFGMPVLEALAAALPTACSAIAPLDWVGGDAAIFFDPNDTATIEAALERITGDEEFRRRARTAGPAQARQFDWNHSAAATLEELERAAK